MAPRIARPGPKRAGRGGAAQRGWGQQNLRLQRLDVRDPAAWQEAAALADEDVANALGYIVSESQ